MKKTYEKPTLQKREKLGAVTAAPVPVASGSGPAWISSTYKADLPSPRVLTDARAFQFRVAPGQVSSDHELVDHLMSGRKNEVVYAPSRSLMTKAYIAGDFV